MKAKVIALIVICMLLCALTLTLTYKPSITQATYKELMAIDEIGEILSLRIIDYLQHNTDCTIDDLLEVEGIGPIKLSNIKEVYK